MSRIGRFTLGVLATFVTGIWFPVWTASVRAGAPDTWTTVAPLPEGLLWPAVASAAGKLYVFGGLGDPSCTNFCRTFKAYDPKSNTWAAAPPLPAPRMDMGVTMGPDGRIYVLGGVATSPDQSENGGVPGLRTVFIYTPRTHCWSPGKPMPDGRYDLAAVTGKDGRIYTIGGATICHDVCEGTQTVRAFNPRTNSWATLAPLPGECLPPKAAVAPNGRIDVFGCDPTRPVLEVYDPMRNRWTEVAGVPQLRTGFAVAPAGDGHIDLIGGCLVYPLSQNSFNAYCGDPNPVDAYDPGTSTWTSLGVTLNARQALAATTGPDGRVYAIGGWGDGNGKLVEVVKSSSMAAAHVEGKKGGSEP